MVSFWPFKGDNNSAASFEKILSQLSKKITEVGAENDRYRLKRRKYKVLWSLYAVFGYILIAAIFLLVIRFENWTAIEYIVVAGGPPFIYAIRAGLDYYYGYRVDRSRSSLNELTKQRDAAIERLKTATKYDRTQQLLEKYGGSPKVQQGGQQQEQKQGATQQQLRKRKSDIGPQSGQQFGRTGFVPPPTANIQSRRQTVSMVRPHSSAGFAVKPPGTPPPENTGLSSGSSGEDFAPNAFSPQTQPPQINRQASQYAIEGPKWYDRVLDVMLGEDETHARNRIVLICENCRLVNGQAPPGTRTLEEVGRWRCGGCHALNGVESEEKKILKQLSQKDGLAAFPEPISEVPDTAPPEKPVDEENEDIKEVIEEEEDAEASSSNSSNAPPADSTRSKIRQRKQLSED